MRKRSSDYQKNSVLKSLYGITLADYEIMAAAQGNVCAICGQQEVRKSRYGGTCRLHVDHDHETGAIRGIICHGCNSGLGLFRDSVDLLEKAKQYLLRTAKEVH
jgi:hypothetical protein